MSERVNPTSVPGGDNVIILPQFDNNGDRVPAEVVRFHCPHDGCDCELLGLPGFRVICDVHGMALVSVGQHLPIRLDEASHVRRVK